MDYSYTQQTHLQNHSQYQQYQQQQEAQSYDPSRVQVYDPSHQAYYSYDHQQQYDHQYPYYNPTTQDYTNSFNNNNTQHQFQQEPTSIHPPGVPIPPDPQQNADPEQTHLQNVYYAHGVVESQQQQHLNSGSDGLKPAALAALSQLSQISGDMEAAQRAMHPPAPIINMTQQQG